MESIRWGIIQLMEAAFYSKPSGWTFEHNHFISYSSTRYFQSESQSDCFQYSVVWTPYERTHLIPLTDPELLILHTSFTDAECSSELKWTR